MSNVLCNSLTRTEADGAVRILQKPEAWRCNDYCSSAQEVQLQFPLPPVGPYTVTVKPLSGGAQQTLSQDDLPDGMLSLTGPSAKYTVTADLMGGDGAVYHAQYMFMFRKEASGA